MSPALNGSSAILRFERSDAIEICDGITFDFYTGLPHIGPRMEIWEISKLSKTMVPLLHQSNPYTKR